MDTASTGLKNSPTHCGEALAPLLSCFLREATPCTLLQYIDDLLPASDTQENCAKGKKALLHFLSHSGYRASRKKAQLCHQKVQNLSFILTQGERALGLERNKVMNSLPQPQAMKGKGQFLS